MYGKNPSISIEFTWATPTCKLSKLNFLKSWLKISSTVLPTKEVPALNISIANSWISTPAILASFLAILVSTGVQVGDLNNNVSETTAPNNKPAIWLGISTSNSSNILVTIVAVEPNGSPLNNNGPTVWISATLWWSTISKISASSIPGIDWPLSLWSTKITFFLNPFNKAKREILPTQRLFKSITGYPRYLVSDITSFI